MVSVAMVDTAIALLPAALVKQNNEMGALRHEGGHLDETGPVWGVGDVHAHKQVAALHEQ